MFQSENRFKHTVQTNTVWKVTFNIMGNVLRDREHWEREYMRVVRAHRYVKLLTRSFNTYYYKK